MPSMMDILGELALNNGRIMALKSQIENICNENRDLQSILEKMIKEATEL